MRGPSASTAHARGASLGEGAAVWAHLGLARQLDELLRPAEAERHQRTALRIAEREMGPTDRMTAFVLDDLGLSLAEQGRPSEALPLHERALPIHQEGPRPDESMGALVGIGRAHLAMRAPLRAIPALERAVRVEHRREEAMVHAEAELLLADALIRAKRTGPRVRQLLVHARDAYRDVGRGPRRERDLARIEVMLSRLR